MQHECCDTYGLHYARFGSIAPNGHKKQRWLSEWPYHCWRNNREGYGVLIAGIGEKAIGALQNFKESYNEVIIAGPVEIISDIAFANKQLLIGVGVIWQFNLNHKPSLLQIISLDATTM